MELVKRIQKTNKFEEIKDCLDREKNQKDCEHYFLRSLNHEMYLQKVKKNHHNYLFR